MRTLFFALLLAVGCNAYGQSIIRNITLKTTDLGNQRLDAAVSGGDTTYVVSVKTGNSIQKYAVAVLGNKDDALRILRFLLDAEISGNDVISLENPTNNVVTKNPLGGFLLHSEGRAFSGQIRKPNIKGFIKAIEEFAR